MPPAWAKQRPSPSSFCMMKPSPPNRPTPIFLWNAIPTETPRAAHRNESFWQMSWPPELGQVQGHDAAGVGGGKGDAVHARARGW